MGNKIKHLEFIQDTVKRMAGNSFLLRGWSITLIVAVLSLASHSFETIYLWLVLLISIMFWLLDSYYLFQERRFRCLYDQVRKKEENNIDFCMKPIDSHCDKCTRLSAIKFSGFLLLYGSMVLITVCALILNYFNITITIK